jgi:hypothetical protein
VLRILDMVAIVKLSVPPSIQVISGASGSGPQALDHPGADALVGQDGIADAEHQGAALDMLFRLS